MDIADDKTYSKHCVTSLAENVFELQFEKHKSNNTLYTSKKYFLTMNISIILYVIILQLN